MATANPFDLLGNDDNDDPSQLLAAAAQLQLKKDESKKGAAAAVQQQQQAKAAKLPSKPLPPAQAVREAKNDGARGGRGDGRGDGRGYGRGRGGGGYGYGREMTNNESSYYNRGFSGGQGAPDDGDGGKSFERRGGYGGSRGSFRGGRRGGFSNGEVEEGDYPRRPFERRSGTGRGNEFKREGAGRGNWGTETDGFVQTTDEHVNEGEKTEAVDKPVVQEEATGGNKEISSNEPEEKKEPEEDKSMTLEEYQKVLEEKRKALESLKTEERKVVVDKELASMQPLSNKKSSDDIFVKLGSDKDKKKEIADKEEKAKKLSINEFLKPAEGERYYGSGRGRGRGRGPRGGGGGGYYQGGRASAEAPAIEDPGEFPTLGGK